MLQTNGNPAFPKTTDRNKPIFQNELSMLFVFDKIPRSIFHGTWKYCESQELKGHVPFYKTNNLGKYRHISWVVMGNLSQFIKQKVDKCPTTQYAN